jgi:hypothetical protein
MISEFDRRQVIDDLKNLPSLKIPPESVNSDIIKNLKLFVLNLKLSLIVFYNPKDLPIISFIISVVPA